MLLSEQISQYALNLSIQQADRERGSIEENVDIEQALSLLPANQRIVIVLFYYHRMTMPEISSCLGVSENTLRKRLLAALDKMRRALHIEEVSEEGYRFTAIEPHISMRRGGAQ
jgi:RNA polymerase sigma factor (sigma-70 family)